MRTPIGPSKILERSGEPSVRDLLSSLVFNPVDGTIRLNGDRIVMQRAIVGAELRRELIRLLGAAEARIFLIRLGFATGQADARFVRTGWPNLDVGDAFTAGTRLHTFTGVVRVQTVYNDFDFRKGRLAAEFIWHDSVEAIEFRNSRHATQPVCWTQLGYASGYATEFFNTLIVYKEVECAGQGHAHCRVVGKPVSGWGAGDPEVGLFLDRIAGLDGRTIVPSAGRPFARAREDGLSELDRVVLSPMKEDLDRVACISLPVLVTGQPGTGRSRAARYLHSAVNASGTELRSVFGASVDLELCDEISRQSKGKRPSAVSRTIVINAVESAAPEIQPHLAMAIEEGVRRDGPRVIAIMAANVAPSVLSSDLWSILSGLEVRMQSLAERPTKQRLSIAECLLSEIASKMELGKPQLDASAVKLIQRLSWPGNMRQMRWVFTSVLRAHGRDVITDLQIETQLGLWPFLAPPAGGDARPIDQAVNQMLSEEEFSLPTLERSLYQAAVKRAAGNFAAAARLLGLTRPQLAYRIKKANLG